MGIQGKNVPYCLLPLLKSIQKPTHLRNFAGQTLGVDAYGWLHRGTVSCAIELAQQKPTRKWIEFTLNRVRMLIHFGVKPFLVFDGDYLPSKSHTEKERAARRKESKKTGLELLRMGRVAQAHLELQKAVDITPVMARELIEELKRLDVAYIVAPYEADSQMAYLEKQGIIDGILSEDSDLLVFGTKCLLTKLDQYGECVMVKRADFTACREISLVGWTDTEFRMMTMLSGCDYLPGIDKMGLKTAYRLVRKHKTIDRVVRTVQFDGKMKVPAGYIESFTRAERTFLYQWVFCPEAQCLVNLHKLPADLDAAEMPYIGKYVEPAIAAGVASGDLDPNTKERIVLPSLSTHPAQRANVVSTPNEKQGKSISEFFKPKRVPLAELDPNSFTPSPSQQRLLENQQSAFWSASQVSALPRPAISRAATDSAPSSAPQASRRAVSSPWPYTNRPSPKRQRLCSDTTLATSMGSSFSLETATSRFFAKQTAQPSPSLRKTSSQKKQDDFELWSDDSIAEAAADLAASQEYIASQASTSPKKRKKIAIFADPQIETPKGPLQINNEPEVDSPSSARTRQSVLAPSAEDQGTPDTSSAASTSEYIFAESITAEFERSKGSGSPPETHRPEGIREGVGQTGSSSGAGGTLSKVSTAQSSRLRDFVLNQCSPRPASARTKSAPSGVLRASQHTLDNSRLPRAETPSPAKVQVPISSPVLDDVRSAEGASGSEFDGRVLLTMPCASPMPAEGLTVHGSEDLIVPGSPSNSGSDDGKAELPSINLRRFAFSGW
ncbi:Helix-hairpin-helix class 2 (Pol1 family) motif protein [Teratosphaeria destructans]|uniref:Helix-hairpin-helix class 2 (Pol1 family) motif protein n=1 Tax=Teratosphaeria destructans TaxID=418781 RepID=A0A9W7T0T1_9PEZI|nr:Helix-hairpin-helix class 2 (Pol1 family) motif protein [Teratosphaeria destructans]